jgi:hypothetical protein
MATEKWIAGAGVGLTWTTIMSTDLNSLASGSALLQAADIGNDSALDLLADFSLHLASAAFVAPNFAALFLYPLNDDASTYGDGRFASAAAMTSANAPSPYWAGNFPLVAATQAQNGTVKGILLPPGKCRMVLWNQGGVNLASSGNTLKYRTYERSFG